MTLSLPQQRIGKSGRPVQFSPQARQFESRVERALEVFEETGNLDFLDHSRAFYNRPSPLDVKTVRAKLAQFSEASIALPNVQREASWVKWMAAKLPPATVLPVGKREATATTATSKPSMSPNALTIIVL